ncbi:hypothetical protein Nmel_012655 [Mimus melanotis]
MKIKIKSIIANCLSRKQRLRQTEVVSVFSLCSSAAEPVGVQDRSQGFWSCEIWGSSVFWRGPASS